MDAQKFNEIIVNLNVLSELKEKNKLVTKETFFNIDTSNPYIQPGLRWWYGNSRDNSITKINLLINEAFNFYKFKPEILNYLEKSKKGLENLKKTYNDCAKSQARINIIIDEINRFLEKNRKNIINLSDENSDFED
jgi:hypothetical protein